jgi:hypothetical protein
MNNQGGKKKKKKNITMIVLFKERPILLKSWVCAVVIEIIDRRGTNPFVDSIRCDMMLRKINRIFIEQIESGRSDPASS